MARKSDPKLDLIAGVPLFAGFSRGELSFLGRLMDEVDVREGRVLTREGASGGEFFVVASGRVRIERGGRKLNELGPGDFLGEIALVDGGPRTATAIATEPCELLVLNRSGFRSLLARYPGVQSKVMRALAARLRDLQPRAPI
jgi:CRP-like cAMP-binding protein